MGVMRIIDATGDTILEWAPDDLLAVARAEAIFDDLRARRQLAFVRRAGESAHDAERVASFDPGAEEIIWVRPIAGG